MKINKKLYEYLCQELQKHPHPKSISQLISIYYKFYKFTCNFVEDDIVRTYPKLSFSHQMNERDFFSELQQILEIFQVKTNIK